jgi:hypothetical protein
MILASYSLETVVAVVQLFSFFLKGKRAEQREGKKERGNW